MWAYPHPTPPRRNLKPETRLELTLDRNLFSLSSTVFVAFLLLFRIRLVAVPSLYADSSLQEIRPMTDVRTERDGGGGCSYPKLDLESQVVGVGSLDTSLLS